MLSIRVLVGRSPPARVVLLGALALALAACASPSSRAGEAADLGSGSPADLSLLPADLSLLPADLSLLPADLSLLPADLSRPGDLAPRDFAGLDGPHALPAITAACGGGVNVARDKHSITLSAGQKASGVAAGMAHRIELGILHGTQAK